MRLGSDLQTYTTPRSSDSPSIWIADPSKKKYTEPVKQLIPRECAVLEKVVPNSGFQVRIREARRVEILIPELSESTWWTVRNLVEWGDFAENLVPYVQINSGVIQGNLEIAFDGIWITFVCPGMPGYLIALEELRRRTNCELCSRTKKWKPGCRYDSAEYSMWYLGEFGSHSLDPKNSAYSKVPVRSVHLFVKSIGSETKISDVFKTHSIDLEEGKDRGVSFDNIIQMRSTTGPLVDVGQELEPDVACLEDLYSDILKAYMERTRTAWSTGSKYSWYPDFSRGALRIFEYGNSISDTPRLDSHTKELFEEIVETNMFKSIAELHNSNYYSSDYSTTDSKTDEENIKAMVAQFWRTTQSENSQKIAYWSEFFKIEGIDLEVVAKRAYNRFTLIRPEIKKDIQSLIDFRIRYCRIMRSKYYRCFYDETLENQFKSSPLLCSLIRDIWKFAKDNYGAGLSSWMTINRGTKTRPRLWYSGRIDLLDIIRWYTKDGQEVPEDLEKELLQECIFDIKIDLPVNKEL